MPTLTSDSPVLGGESRTRVSASFLSSRAAGSLVALLTEACVCAVERNQHPGSRSRASAPEAAFLPVSTAFAGAWIFSETVLEREPASSNVVEGVFLLRPAKVCLA